MVHLFREVLVRIIVLQVDSVLDQVSLREGVSIHEEEVEEVEEEDGKLLFPLQIHLIRKVK